MEAEGQDSNNQMKVVKKIGQNGVGMDLSKMGSRHEDGENGDYQLTNCLLRALTLLLESSKKKKFSPKDSDRSKLHGKHSSRRQAQRKNPMRTISLDTDLYSGITLERA